MATPRAPLARDDVAVGRERVEAHDHELEAPVDGREEQQPGRVVDGRRRARVAAWRAALAEAKRAGWGAPS